MYVPSLERGSPVQREGSTAIPERKGPFLAPGREIERCEQAVERFNPRREEGAEDNGFNHLISSE